MAIPERAQDPFSCLYYFRTLSAEKIKVGQSVSIAVNTDEKNWDLDIDILETKHLEILSIGAYDAVLLEPKAKFQGIFVRKGRMWVWVSTDERRLPLILRTKIPIAGSIYASLEKIE
jgi:acetylornithine deacetylase/succinyl-diaminopimelate desuccinylase-like protein